MAFVVTVPATALCPHHLGHDALIAGRLTGLNMMEFYQLHCFTHRAFASPRAHEKCFHPYALVNLECATMSQFLRHSSAQQSRVSLDPPCKRALSAQAVVNNCHTTALLNLLVHNSQQLKPARFAGSHASGWRKSY